MVPERVTAVGGRRVLAAAILATAVLGVTACLLTLSAHLVERQLAPARGLTRSIFVTPDFSGPPQLRDRVDRIDLSLLVEDPDLPRERLSVRWEGFWSVPDHNPIEFYTRADNRLEIFVDGERVLERDRSDGTRMVAQRVVVTPGVRRVRLDYVQRDGVARLVVEWAPAGGPRRRFDAAPLFPETPSSDLGAAYGAS